MNANFFPLFQSSGNPEKENERERERERDKVPVIRFEKKSSKLIFAPVTPVSLHIFSQ
jgi:hypothetical protein